MVTRDTAESDCCAHAVATAPHIALLPDGLSSAGNAPGRLECRMERPSRKQSLGSGSMSQEAGHIKQQHPNAAAGCR